MTAYALFLLLTECNPNMKCVSLYDSYSTFDECMYYGIMIKTVNPVERLCLEVVRE